MNCSLQYGVLESGHIILEETEFSVKEMLEAALAQHRAKADLKQIRLHLTLDPFLPETLIGDAPRLRELLGHLVNNAIKFTHTGSVDVQVSMRTTAPQKPDSLVVRVHDTGIGIPADQLDSIFESFRPGESGLARAYPGLGLGLALAQKLAKVMRGRILVESQPGVGSTFTLEVPLRGSVPAPESQHARAAGLGPAVLAVEDDPIGMTVLRHVLQRRLKNVDCVGSGREALEAVARRHYDLILMDLQMPDIDGLQAAAQIRRMKGYSDVPILALTASCSDQVREQCRAIGMQAFLSKPIDANELWSAVSRYLGREIPR
jgi:CheY-like chemotaxis protein